MLPYNSQSNPCQLLGGQSRHPFTVEFLPKCWALGLEGSGHIFLCLIDQPLVCLGLRGLPGWRTLSAKTETVPGSRANLSPTRTLFSLLEGSFSNGCCQGWEDLLWVVFLFRGSCWASECSFQAFCLYPRWSRSQTPPLKTPALSPQPPQA